MLVKLLSAFKAVFLSKIIEYFSFISNIKLDPREIGLSEPVHASLGEILILNFSKRLIVLIFSKKIARPCHPSSSKSHPKSRSRKYSFCLPKMAFPPNLKFVNYFQYMFLNKNYLYLI